MGENGVARILARGDVVFREGPVGSIRRQKAEVSCKDPGSGGRRADSGCPVAQLPRMRKRDVLSRYFAKSHCHGRRIGKLRGRGFLGANQSVTVVPGCGMLGRHRVFWVSLPRAVSRRLRAHGVGE